MNIKKCVPLFDRVLVEVLDMPEKQPKSGLILPKEQNTEGILFGEIIAVGEGRFNEDGDMRIPPTVTKGDVVAFSRYGFDEIEIDAKKYLIGREDQLLAIVDTTKKK